MKNQLLLESFEALLEAQPTEISVLSNASAFIFENIEQLNWAGFYLYDGKRLILGPFQGRVACSTIELGKGVCGEAAIKRQTLVIDDVLSHENHIACDSHSRSEVVVPIILKNKLYGVLDVDSPIFNRFDQDLVSFFESFVEILIKSIDK
ncbi:MAG: GAF domain-containing protein [Acholeplasmataceae bacterium]|jgi:GAF domain-containing protein|nr:GAF domain-containing protein [Acholeplasmataceae bacterium]